MVISKSWLCKTEQDTEALGRKAAAAAVKGDCFALYGTLGSGKSVFCRAFVRHLTDAREVPSPTFTLVQSYPAKDFDIYHFDLYRLKSAEEIFELGMEEALYDGVCLIEWPEKMAGYLPEKAIEIEIRTDNNGRRITISGPERLVNFE